MILIYFITAYSRGIIIFSQWLIDVRELFYIFNERMILQLFFCPFFSISVRNSQFILS